MKIKIELIKIGANHISKNWIEDIKTKDLKKAIKTCEKKAFNEADQFLLSSNTYMTPNEEDYGEINTYNVMAGFRTVGAVIITKIK